MSLEIAVVLLGLGLLLMDLWTPVGKKKALGYFAAMALFILWIVSLTLDATPGQHAFGTAYAFDEYALFFKRLFLLAAGLVILMAIDFSDRFPAGQTEFHALVIFALAGMMFAASANSFVMLYVSLELITVTFYILTAFQRNRLSSLEAGVKYLILGALSSAFMVFGIALVFGTSGTLGFKEIAQRITAHPELINNVLFQAGMIMVLGGLGFKIAAFPFQIWTPDVYQGAPTPVTAFLAIGSKAAGFALLTRLLVGVMPDLAASWGKLLIIICGVTILYGNLCALPQRNIKRLLGYSSIAHAGYLLLGVIALNRAGTAAILYYLTGYLFTVLAAFTVITYVAREIEAEDISSFAGLGRRSPLLALAMTLAMVSLAGVPPLAGFFGKFLLLKAVIIQGSTNYHLYCLAGVAIVGVVISFWYYFGVIKAIFWTEDTADLGSIEVSFTGRLSLYACIIGMLYLGMFPNLPLWLAEQGAAVLR